MILAGANGAYGAAAGNISMVDPTGFKKIDKHTMTVKLIRPWSDMASAFGQRYLSIVKNGSQGSVHPPEFHRHRAFRADELDSRDALRLQAQSELFRVREAVSERPRHRGDPRPSRAGQRPRRRPGRRDRERPRSAGGVLKGGRAQHHRQPRRFVGSDDHVHRHRAIQRSERSHGDETSDRSRAGDQVGRFGLRAARKRPLRAARPALRQVDPAAASTIPSRPRRC